MFCFAFLWLLAITRFLIVVPFFWTPPCHFILAVSCVSNLELDFTLAHFCSCSPSPVWSPWPCCTCLSSQPRCWDPCTLPSPRCPAAPAMTCRALRKLRHPGPHGPCLPGGLSPRQGRPLVPKKIQDEIGTANGGVFYERRRQDAVREMLGEGRAYFN